MIKVSIIIPVYNVAQYIRRCIESIFVQESAACDIECIIVNDCTPDDSMDIVHTMVDDYHGKIHFVVCNHDMNKGLSAARNTGIMSATGDYLLFVDSDDYLSDDCLDSMINGLNIYPNVDVIVGNALSRKYNEPFFPPVSKLTLLTDKNDVLRRVFFAKLHFHAWNRLVRRDFITHHKLFFIDGLLYEDMPWTYMLMAQMSSMLVIPNNTYIYEYNENSIVNTTANKINQVVSSVCYIVNYILDHIVKDIRSDCRIYCFGILLRTIDKTKKYPCSKEFSKLLVSTQCRLVKEAFRSGRLLLTLFFLTSLKPLFLLYSVPIIRMNYHRLTVIFSKVESPIDKYL